MRSFLPYFKLIIVHELYGSHSMERHFIYVLHSLNLKENFYLLQVGLFHLDFCLRRANLCCPNLHFQYHAAP